MTYLRELTDEGFECEIECNGELHKFSYERPVRDGESVKVCTFKWSRKLGITEIAASIPEASTNISKEIWGINTNKFQKVSMYRLTIGIISQLVTSTISSCWKDVEVPKKLEGSLMNIYRNL